MTRASIFLGIGAIALILRNLAIFELHYELGSLLQIIITVLAKDVPYFFVFLSTACLAYILSLSEAGKIDSVTAMESVDFFGRSALDWCTHQRNIESTNIIFLFFIIKSLRKCKPGGESQVVARRLGVVLGTTIKSYFDTSNSSPSSVDKNDDNKNIGKTFEEKENEDNGNGDGKGDGVDSSTMGIALDQGVVDEIVRAC